MKSNLITSLLVLAALVGIHVPAAQAAYQAEQLPDATVYDDFVVGPGKVQLEMKPGETRTVNVMVTNRLGTLKDFQIELEDFVGSRDPERTVVLLESEKGPYSLRDYLEIPELTFTVGHAERVTVPVTIRVPEDAQPGGLYGSVVVSTVSRRVVSAPEGSSSAGTSPIITRIGILFFIRVAGEVIEDARLSKFEVKDGARFLSSGPVDFRLLYENNGTVHENPSGLITVRNILGAPVGSIEVEPWFALPNSLRLREVTWNAPFLFGRYEATASIERGYGDLSDELSLSFWVIPWKILLVAFISLALVVAVIRWILSKFTFSIATKK